MSDRKLRREIWKSTLRVYIPVLFLTLSAGLLLIRISSQRQGNSIRGKVVLFAKTMQIRMVGTLREPLRDLKVLRGMQSLKAYLDAPSAKSYEILSRDILGLSRAKDLYDQIRYLDAQGQEVVRVNLDPQGNAYLVDKTDLQVKQHRYYISRAAPLLEGEYYISPMDLNIERGEIEVPHKPMIRFVAPVRGERGELKGFLVLNYIASDLLAGLGRVAQMAPGDVALLNGEGYWLYGGKSEDRWGFMHPGRSARTFASREPEAWKQILQQRDKSAVTVHGDFFVSLSVNPVGPARGIGRGGAAPMSDSRKNRNDLSLRLVCHLCRQEIRESVLRVWIAIPLVVVLLDIALLVLIYMVIRQRRSRQLLIRQTRKHEESLRSHDLDIASEIQSTLLLDAVPKDLVGLDVARTSIPATEVGGDFLAFWLQSGCLDVLVGDVMGKGIPGALLAAALKIRFTNARISEYAVAEGTALPSLDAILRHSHETITPILMNFERFATLNYLRIDLGAGRAEWINCGHTELIHCRAKGLGISHIPGDNVPLGFTQECKFRSQSASVASGDVLVLYSDGISEATNANSEMYGVERLMTLVQKNRGACADELLAASLREVETFAGENARRDDLTCAVLCVQ